jgi:hypothetical protein
MPEPLWISRMALLYFPRLLTCATITEAFEKASHDRLTRMLNGDWSGPEVWTHFIKWRVAKAYAFMRVLGYGSSRLYDYSSQRFYRASIALGTWPSTQSHPRFCAGDY